MSLFYFSKETAFFHSFLRAISFFQSFSILLLLQKRHFASLKRIGLPQKEEKCHFSFSLMKRHFFIHFYVPFHFFQPPFDLVCRPKAAFCKAKVHRGSPKEGKMSVPFFLESNGIFACIFTCQFIF